MELIKPAPLERLLVEDLLLEVGLNLPVLPISKLA